MPAKWRARTDGAAVRLAVRRLQALQNVTHVTVGEKITQGQHTGVRSLKVHVTEKRDVKGTGRIPSTIVAQDSIGNSHRFVTDVIEVGGTPELFGMRTGHRIIAFDRDLGLAGLTFTKANRSYVLTNAHVVCDVARGGVSGVAGWLDPPQLTRALGRVVMATALTQGHPTGSDVAIIEVGNQALLDPLQVVGSSSPIKTMGMMHRFASPIYLPTMGTFLSCVEPEPVLGDTPVMVDGVVLHYRNFWQVRNVDRLARGGLSGGVLVRLVDGAFEICGLVFGGVPTDYLWAFSFKNMFGRIYEDLTP